MESFDQRGYPSNRTAMVNTAERAAKAADTKVTESITKAARGGFDAAYVVAVAESKTPK